MAVENLKAWSPTNFGVYLLVCILSYISYHRCHDGTFAYDDVKAISKNADVLPQTSIENVFKHDFWSNDMTDPGSHKSYRPLTVITYRLNYMYAGGLHARGFHIVNTILHTCVCLVLYNVLCNILPNNKKHSTSIKKGSGEGLSTDVLKASTWQLWNSVPFLATILFTVHPIHTEAVCALVGRADLMTTLFALMAFRCYIYSCQLSQKSNEYTPRGLRQTHIVSHVASLFLCAVFTVLAVLSKELGITIIAICSSYDFLLNQPACRKCPHNRKSYFYSLICCGDGLLQREKEFVLRHVFLFMTGAAILYSRWLIMAGETPSFSVTDNPTSHISEKHLRIINFNYIYSLNMWISLCPWWLSCDWALGSIPPITSVTGDYRLVFPCLLHIFFLLFFYKTLFYTPTTTVKQSERSSASASEVQEGDWADNSSDLERGIVYTKQRLLLFSMSAVLLPFLPAANILFQVGFVIAERVLYMSSVGLCLMVAIAIENIHSKATAQTLVQPPQHVVAKMEEELFQGKSNIMRCSMLAHICTLLLLVLFVLRCLSRCNDWITDANLFASGVKVCPLNSKLQYNLGLNYRDEEMQLKHYRRAVSVHPVWTEAYNNIGTLLHRLNQNEEAVVWLQKALEVYPDFVAAWINLGNVQGQLRRMEDAKKSYMKAYSLWPQCSDCFYNLGLMYEGVGRKEEAVQAFTNATRVSVHDEKSWYNLALTLSQLGQRERAEEVTRKAVEHNPNSAHVLFMRARSLLELHESNNNLSSKVLKELERILYRALGFRRLDIDCHNLLGVIYYKWGMYLKAKQQYLNALAIDPNNNMVRNNYQVLLNAMADVK